MLCNVPKRETLEMDSRTCTKLNSLSVQLLSTMALGWNLGYQRPLANSSRVVGPFHLTGGTNIAELDGKISTVWLTD